MQESDKQISKLEQKDRELMQLNWGFLTTSRELFEKFRCFGYP